MQTFFTKRGWLTQYAMVCGYLHESQRKNYHAILSMNNAELNTYDVKVFFANGGERIWDVVEGINNARKLYKQYCNGNPIKRERKSYEPFSIPAIVYA